MKKFTALLFSVIFLIAIFVPSVSANTSGVYNYSLINEGKEVRITRSLRARGALTIPARIAGKPVTQIGADAFSSNETITSVTIPASVRSIGANAFYANRNLTNVTIPKGVRTIGANAFDHCVALRSVKLPSTLTTIGAWAFAFSGLTSISIPASVTKMGSFAFYGCDSLTSVKLSSGLKSIPASAFESCTRLKSITIPSSVRTIGKLAFAGCGALTTVKMTQSVTSIASNAFIQCGNLKSLTINATIGVGEKYTLPKYAGSWRNSKNKKISSTTIQGSAVGKTSFHTSDSSKRRLTVNINVKASPTKVEFNTKSVTLKRKETFNTKVTFTPAKAHTRRTYKSADPKIATVSSTGRITAVSKGRTTITVRTYNGRTAKFTVTVR